MPTARVKMPSQAQASRPAPPADKKVGHQRHGGQARTLRNGQQEESKGPAADEPVIYCRGGAQFQGTGKGHSPGHVQSVEGPNVADQRQSDGAGTHNSRRHRQDDARAIAINQPAHEGRYADGAQPAQADHPGEKAVRPAKLPGHGHGKDGKGGHRHQGTG